MRFGQYASEKNELLLKLQSEIGTSANLAERNAELSQQVGFLAASIEQGQQQAQKFGSIEAALMAEIEELRGFVRVLFQMLGAHARDTLLAVQDPSVARHVES